LSLFLLQSRNDIQLDLPSPTPTMGRSPCKKRGTTAEASAIIVVCEILTLSPIQDAEAEIAHFPRRRKRAKFSVEQTSQRGGTRSSEGIAKTVTRPKLTIFIRAVLQMRELGSSQQWSVRGSSEVEKESWSNGPTNSWASLTHTAHG
jgi:hypothetical protein